MSAIFSSPAVSKNVFGLTKGVPAPCDNKSAEALLAFAKQKHF